jgi:hypothetical protein
VNEPMTVGYIVFTGDIDTAALYPVSEREAAFDAAKRWGACISSVVLHPNSPQLPLPPPPTPPQGDEP